MSKQLPQIPLPLRETLDLQFIYYIDTLRHANTLYPQDVVSILEAILNYSGKWTMKEPDRWTTGVSRTFEQDPLDIALMAARDTATNGGLRGGKYVTSFIPTDGCDTQIWVHQQVNRLVGEWRHQGARPPIVHEWQFYIVSLLSDQSSRILGEIPIPRLADDLYWGTTRSNRTEEVAYRGIFCDAGYSSWNIWLYGGEPFFFQTFGISLWLVWPPLEENLAAFPENSPSISWCLENLTGLSVYFMHKDASNADPRINISHGSLYYFVAFMPVHILYAVVYGRALFAEFANVTDCLNKVIARGAYRWEFSKWYSLTHDVYHGKRLWRYFFASIGQKSYVEHPILGPTEWENMKADQGWPSQRPNSTRTVILGMNQMTEDNITQNLGSSMAVLASGPIGKKMAGREYAWSTPSSPQWKRLQLVTRGDLAFSDGLPVENIQHPLTKWCFQNTGAFEMGAADNVVVYALFKAKSPTTSSIIPEDFPITPSLEVPARTKRALCDLVKELDGVDPAIWPETYGTRLQSVIEPLVIHQAMLWELLKSDEFQRAFFRHTIFRHSTRVRIGGVRFQGQTIYQACVISSKDIAKDTLLWEMCGVLSSDSGGKSCSTVKPHHKQRQKKDESSDRWLVGPARFCNHCCDNNAILLPIHNRPAMVIQTIKQINAGQEITLSYGTRNGLTWKDRCSCDKCTGSKPVCYT